MADLATAYLQTQSSMVTLLRGAEGGLDARVPASPDWSIKDVLAHVTYVAGTFAKGQHPYSSQDLVDSAHTLAGDLPAIDAEMNRAVAEARFATLEELVWEWHEHARNLATMMNGEGDLPPSASATFLSWAAVVDLATHYQDCREALGLQPDRTDYGTKLAFSSYTSQFATRASSAGVAPFTIRTQRGDIPVGAGERTDVIEIDWYDLLRATSGRRSEPQIRQLFRGVDADALVELISPYPLPRSPLQG